MGSLIPFFGFQLALLILGHAGSGLERGAAHLVATMFVWRYAKQRIAEAEQEAAVLAGSQETP